MISIIVPVYNVEKYVERCVNSILKQTYPDFEAILIDDGSTDSSGEKCDLFSRLDGRIRVVHQRNGGLSAARNTGLRAARGEYVCFIDSDDAVSSSFLQVLRDVIENEKSDVVSCSRLDVYDDTLPDEPPTGGYSVTNFSRERAIESLINNRELHQTVWDKIYKRETIGECLFEEGKLHEDEFFTWKVLEKSRKISVVSLPLYYYYHRKGSIMETFSIRRLDFFEARYERHESIVRNYPGLILASKLSIELPCIFMMQRALRCEDKALRKAVIPALKKYYGACRLSAAERKTLPQKQRITIGIADISLFLCAFLRNATGKKA